MVNEDKQANEDKKAIKQLDNLREKGDWETELSDISPLKDEIIRPVSKVKELSNGLTPYEIMYGKQDDDYDILGQSLE